jgi:hypothetical protein
MAKPTEQTIYESIRKGTDEAIALEESKKSKEYQEFFQKKLDKYGVKSPEDLDDEKKKKFFDEVDKDWKGEKGEE